MIGIHGVQKKERFPPLAEPAEPADRVNLGRCIPRSRVAWTRGCLGLCPTCPVQEDPGKPVLFNHNHVG